MHKQEVTEKVHFSPQCFPKKSTFPQKISLTTTSNNQNDNMILLDTLLGKKTDRVPIWLMRQAGRYLREYRELRSKFPSFLDLVLSPSGATEVTLQPIKRFNFDAAIVFSDILVVPYGLGQSVRFFEGIEMSDIDVENIQFHKEIFDNKIAPVLETLKNVRQELSPDKALIGFCGGPFTVSCYMLEGRNTHGFPKARHFALSKEKAFAALIDTLVEASIHFLCAQIKAGANVVQIFESWASLVPWQRQKQWLIQPLKKIIDSVRRVYPDFPIIVFLKGVSTLLTEFESEVDVTALSLDSGYSLKHASNLKSVIQGNLDPQILLEGGSILDEAIEDIKSFMKNKSFIFNLGHGILPGTPVENVGRLVDLVQKA